MASSLTEALWLTSSHAWWLVFPCVVVVSYVLCWLLGRRL